MSDTPKVIRLGPDDKVREVVMIDAEELKQLRSDRDTLAAEVRAMRKPWPRDNVRQCDLFNEREKARHETNASGALARAGGGA